VPSLELGDELTKPVRQKTAPLDRWFPDPASVATLLERGVPRGRNR
jgi:hypothetical protein